MGCKYAGDEFSRRCNCRKHLRWSQHGKQYRKKANTRGWAEAEAVKRELEDQLSGRVTEPKEIAGRNLRSAIDLFIADKKVQGLTPDLISKYRLWLGRLASYCESEGVYAVQGVTRELITGFCSGWEEQYPASLTRSKLRERYKSFMRFCHEAGWVEKLPAWPKIQTETTPTLPLSPEEYTRLLDAVYVTIKDKSYDYWCKRVHGLFQLMRWSGLSIMDSLTLRRAELIHDRAKGVHRIVTQRTKTGTDVSVVIPPDVVEELLAIPNDNPNYFFWSGRGSPKSICGNWGKRFILPVFTAANIERNGHMLAHRLRDTFAVELLKKGVPLEDVSKLLGHKSIKTTEKSYAAWVSGRQNRLDSLVIDSWALPEQRSRPGRKRATTR